MTEFTAEQRAVVDAAPGPVRIVGGFGTGKTVALQARADRLAERAGGRRVLVLTRSRATAQRVRETASAAVEPITFVDFALGILTGKRGPVRLVERPEQQAIVEGLITTEGKERWPTLHDELSDVAFADEVADIVLLYQSSFLAAEELHVHAEAAGALAEWEQLHRFSERYLDALDERRAVDTSGALVQASLLLRDESVAADVRQRYAAVLVDDYELATFATNRLVTQLVGRGGNVTVAGNPDAAVQGIHGSSPAHLERFPERFPTMADVVLSEPLRHVGAPAVVAGDGLDEPVAVAEQLETARAGGLSWSEMAVLTRTEHEARTASSRLPRGFTVATIDAAGGLEWSLVIVAGCSEGRLPLEFRSHRWFDPWVLGGPDVPPVEERERLWMEEERRRFALAASRATGRIVLIAPAPVSRFVGRGAT